MREMISVLNPLIRTEGELLGHIQVNSLLRKVISVQIVWINGIIILRDTETIYQIRRAVFDRISVKLDGHFACIGFCSSWYLCFVAIVHCFLGMLNRLNNLHWTVLETGSLGNIVILFPHTVLRWQMDKSLRTWTIAYRYMTELEVKFKHI